MPEQNCSKCGNPLEGDKPCLNCLLQLAAAPAEFLDADLTGVSPDDIHTHDWSKLKIPFFFDFRGEILQFFHGDFRATAQRYKL